VPQKRRKASPFTGVSRAEFNKLRRELARSQSVTAANAASLDALSRDCVANLRRCGELQNEIDKLNKLLSVV